MNEKGISLALYYWIWFNIPSRSSCSDYLIGAENPNMCQNDIRKRRCTHPGLIWAHTWNAWRWVGWTDILEIEVVNRFADRWTLVGGATALAKRFSQLESTRDKLQNKKLASAGSWASLQETIQLSEYDRSWLELAEVPGQTEWLEVWAARIWAWLNSSQLEPTQAIQMGGQTIRNSIEVVNLARVGKHHDDGS